MYRKLRAFTKKKEGEDLIQFPLTNFSQKATFPYRADVDTAAALPPPPLPPPPRPQDSPLVVRHALAQILVFTLREVEQVSRLIQSIDSTNCFHKRRDQTRISRLIARALPPHATTKALSEDEL